jgi:hypothetical protein
VNRTSGERRKGRWIGERSAAREVLGGDEEEAARDDEAGKERPQSCEAQWPSGGIRKQSCLRPQNEDVNNTIIHVQFVMFIDMMVDTCDSS